MATLIGTPGPDFLLGTPDADLIFGEDGDDYLLGAAGDDQINSGNGNDLLQGNAGNDLIDGGSGDDTLSGGIGNDTLNGGDGDDLIYADSGLNRLNGGQGADTLVAGTGGRDVMTGGPGRDVFVLANGTGGSRRRNANVIADFNPNQDRIGLAGDLRFNNLSIVQGTGNNRNNVIIRNRQTGEFLAIVRNVNVSRLTRTNVVAFPLPARDTTPPSAANLVIANPNITVAGGTTQTFTIQYADAVQLNSLSFRNGNLLVTGPNGFVQGAQLVGFTPVGNGTSRTVTYQITAPGGTWDANDNGTYQVSLQAGQIFDTSGNAAPPATLGSFNVSVPIPIVPVSVAVSPANVVEDSGGTLVYTFTRTTYIRNALTVNFTLGGTATRGSDYNVTGASITGSTGTIIFAPNASTATIRVTPIADNLVEPNETVIVALAPGVGYSLASASSATGTIIDDESQIALSVSPASVLEDSGSELVYTFTRTGFLDRSITVSFGVGGTAGFGVTSDYTVNAPPGTTFTYGASAGTITFGAGESTKTLRIRPNADTVVEPDETVALTLNNGVGYARLTTAPVVGTILNDDSSVSVAVLPNTVLEDSGTGMVYTFTRNGFTGNAITVNFTVGGTATLGGPSSDYTITGATVTGGTGTISFAAGETTKTITVTPTSDNVVEPNETVVVGVAAGTGYIVGTSSNATGTIQNDDSSVQLSVSPSSVLEDSGNDLVFTFTRTAFLDRPITVNFGVGGTATFSTDYTVSAPVGTTFTYTALGGTVQFAAGESTKTILVKPVADSNLEPNELVTLTLQPGTGYTPVSTTPVSGIIEDDDAIVTLTVSPDNVLEDSGQEIVYTFTRVGAMSRELTVSFTVGGTAVFGTAGNDYTVEGAASFNPTAGTIKFAPGATTAVLRIKPVADLDTIEPDETISLTLVNGPGYTSGTASPQVSTIRNDDGIVTNTNDSGAGSLRQAIIAANNNNSILNPTITFAPSVSGTIQLASALPTLSRNMTIDGPGAGTLTISRNSTDNFRIFTLQSGIEATIEGLTISGGNAGIGNGGGIANLGGTLTLQNLVVQNNQARLGGGIFNQSGTLTLINTNVNTNAAVQTESQGGAGGGISNQAGTVNIQGGSQIVDNTAVSIGGGVSNDVGGTLNVTGAAGSPILFSGNIAQNSSGGGLYNAGTSTINFANFVNNRASNIGSGGGGIFVAPGGVLTVNNSIFNNSPLNTPNNLAGDLANFTGSGNQGI
ncbi:Calx-beta domain-containing protein [Leptolyngbya sp. O-77]|uniref:Calx-beta domain-containing protein n=1 Tax=Leptolyngbya sp. O-77 TaxID=1080068 RepID=UPI00074D35AA|nr:Calx-beta domain-containing protein [Leptolyngbya sp. O-77]BAU44459.1 Hemolysin, plasmid [Leptolyngbya sp. O-77]